MAHFASQTLMDFIRVTPQSGVMPGRDDPSESSNAIAREAEPMRQALAGYFRRRIANPSEAEDLVQEVFSRIVARDSQQPIEHLAGYVFQVAASVLADRGRRRGVRHADAHVPFDPDRHGEQDFDPERVLSGKQRLRAATAALLSLPERTRTIFLLHRLEGRRYREIAEQIGISVSAVEKHMVRAVQHLGAAFEARS
jgi:RNA polymerase sigma-70 factor (ECF subfamily)